MGDKSGEDRTVVLDDEKELDVMMMMQHVDKGPHLVGVLHDDPVEETLVALLEGYQVTVLLEGALQGRKIGHHPLHLERLRHLERRQEPWRKAAPAASVKSAAVY